MKNSLIALKKFLSNKKNIAAVVGGGLAFTAVVGGLIYYIAFRDLPDTPGNDNVQAPASESYQVAIDSNCANPRKLDGVCVEEEKDNLPVYGVMIENSLDAWPQIAVAKANLVYEAIAEGGITRFLVLFDSSQQIAKIGPVRSARTYFLEWAQEYGAVHAHIGGSPEALELAKKRPIYDLDEFFNAATFWRGKDRAAPHNVYTSTDLLNKTVVNKKWEIKPDYQSWQFKSEAPVDTRGENKTVMIDFESYYYSVKWQYNKEDNDYTRYQAGEVHKDADGSIIKAKNIAVMYSTSYVIVGDDKGRRFTQTVGSGKAFVLQDGQMIKGTWKREKLSERTRFYDEKNEEVSFNRGTTWVEVLPTGFADPKID
jgi:hypothetical protein